MFFFQMQIHHPIFINGWGEQNSLGAELSSTAGFKPAKFQSLGSLQLVDPEGVSRKWVTPVEAYLRYIYIS